MDLGGELFSGPRQWDRWPAGDELGRANLLDAANVLRAASAIRTGKRYSLALVLNSAAGDAVLEGRPATEHRMLREHADYVSGRVADVPGGMRSTDDTIMLACHGTTHIDALGHAYAGDTLYAGVPADTTDGGLEHADIAAIAAHGVVGRAVLVDLPRFRGTERVPRGEHITITEVKAALAHQGTRVQAADTLLVRTGTAPFFSVEEPVDEPGLSFEPELLDFLDEFDVAGLGTDTLCNEQAHSSTVAADYPLHVVLQRNLGILFHEALWLEDWADDCAADGVYEAFYVAAPLRLRHGSGGPVNPIVIK
jgi:kynurenine formamidase